MCSHKPTTDDGMLFTSAQDMWGEMISNMFRRIYAQPLYLVVVEMVLLIILWAWFKYRYGKKLWWKLFNAVVFVIVVFAIFYSTVYSRTENFQEPVFMPFHSFYQAKTQPEIYRAMLMNIFLFEPIGLSLPNILPEKAHPVAVTVIMALLLSVLVEAAQYYFFRGRCETDDVIMNTLGAVLGGRAYGRWLRKIKLLERLRINCLKKP